MNRVVYFFRSLLPIDPTQLLLLAGLVCLTVAPHLNWLSEDFRTFVQSVVSAGGTSDGISGSWNLFLQFAFYSLEFAAAAGFFACLWPGRRPARRIFWLVLLPAFMGLGGVCFRYLTLLARPRSVLQKGFSFEHGPTWVIARLSNLGAAFHFCVAGLLVIATFALLLTRNKASLPISVSPQGAEVRDESDGWRGAKRLIWLFQGAAVLVLIPLNVISLLTLLLVPMGKPLTAADWHVQASRALWPAAEGVVFLPIAIWAMGKENRKFVRELLRPPRLSYVGLGLGLAALSALLPSLLIYLHDRAYWAAHAFGKLEPPRIGDYLGVPEAWTLALFLAAFGEEVIFRGVLQRHFIERFGTRRGICFVGIIWGAFHFYGDARYRLNDLGMVLELCSRLTMCVVHGFGLSWLTLRSKSLLPATLAHGLYNVFVETKSSLAFPGQSWVHLGLWGLFAYVLFRYWPPQPESDALPVVDEETAPAT